MISARRDAGMEGRLAQLVVCLTTKRWLSESGGCGFEPRAGHFFLTYDIFDVQIQSLEFFLLHFNLNLSKFTVLKYNARHYRIALNAYFDVIAPVNCMHLILLYTPIRIGSNRSKSKHELILFQSSEPQNSF